MMTIGLYGIWKDRVPFEIREKINAQLSNMKLFPNSKFNSPMLETISDTLARYIRLNVDDTVCKIILFLQVLKEREQYGLLFDTALFEEVIAYLSFVQEPMKSMLEESANEIKRNYKTRKINVKFTIRYFIRNIPIQIYVFLYLYLPGEDEKRIDNLVQEMEGLIESCNNAGVDELFREAVRIIRKIKNRECKLVLYSHFLNFRNKIELPFHFGLWKRCVRQAMMIREQAYREYFLEMLFEINVDWRRNEFYRRCCDM